MATSLARWRTHSAQTNIKDDQLLGGGVGGREGEGADDAALLLPHLPSQGETITQQEENNSRRIISFNIFYSYICIYKFLLTPMGVLARWTLR